jgi:hypothetical protein
VYVPQEVVIPVNEVTGEIMNPVVGEGGLWVCFVVEIGKLIVWYCSCLR